MGPALGGGGVDAEEVGHDDGRQVGDGLHQGGVARGAYGKAVLLHLVGQTGGVAGAAGHGARQEEMPAALRGLWGGELGDLFIEQGGQRRWEQDGVAVEGEVGGLGFPVELVVAADAIPPVSELASATAD